MGMALIRCKIRLLKTSFVLLSSSREFFSIENYPQAFIILLFPDRLSLLPAIRLQWTTETTTIALKSSLPRRTRYFSALPCSWPFRSPERHLPFRSVPQPGPRLQDLPRGRNCVCLCPISTLEPSQSFFLPSLLSLILCFSNLHFP